MKNIIKRITPVFFWIRAFTVPFLFCAVTSFFIYPGNGKYDLMTIIIPGIGVVAGVVFAEFVRRKYGFAVFFSKVFGAADIDEKVRMK